MPSDSLRAIIDAAWERRTEIRPGADPELERAVEAALDKLDSGAVRVAEPKDGGWVVNQWLKKAVLLSFRLADNAVVSGALAAGTDRSRTQARQQDRVWFGRRGKHDPSGKRVVECTRRDEHGTRALQGRRRGIERADER
jgi:2,3,4,5-tetrahydropyridine-2,6-dicarboxylate N-succinyltransferase